MGFNYLNMLYGFIISSPIFIYFLNSMLKTAKKLKDNKNINEEIKTKQLQKFFIKKSIPIAIFIYIITQIFHIEGFLGLICSFILIEKFYLRKYKISRLFHS